MGKKGVKSENLVNILVDCSCWWVPYQNLNLEYYGGILHADSANVPDLFYNCKLDLILFLLELPVDYEKQ